MRDVFNSELYAREIRGKVLAGLGKDPTPCSVSAVVRGVVEKAEKDLSDRLDSGERAHIACAAGCGVCCMVNVAILFPEAVAIADYLRENLGPEGMESLSGRIENLYRKIQWLDDEERIFLRRPCAFLDDAGSCSIYPVRPLLCRSVTSTDPEVCRQAIAMQALGERVPVLMNLVQKAIMEAAYQGMGQALEEAGMDARGVKLTVAVKHLLENPGLVSEYLSGAAVPKG